jgi:hypothetical protein
MRPPSTERQRAADKFFAESVRLSQETREHLRRARRLIDGLPRDW